jgi:hypothetical protein
MLVFYGASQACHQARAICGDQKAERHGCWSGLVKGKAQGMGGFSNSKDRGRQDGRLIACADRVLGGYGREL